MSKVHPAQEVNCMLKHFLAMYQSFGREPNRLTSTARVQLQKKKNPTKNHMCQISPEKLVTKLYFGQVFPVSLQQMFQCHLGTCIEEP